MPLLTAHSPQLRAGDSRIDSAHAIESTIAVATIPPPPYFTPQSVAITPPPVSNLGRSSFSGSRAVCESVAMPQPGDDFHGFRLMEELGHGTFARVFLAKQEALAGRAVALKVTLRATREPERIARLQHTNVVPVYSVHTADPVQIICMPYLGRRTLADALVGYRKSQVEPGHSTRKAYATRKGSSVAGSRTRTGTRFPTVSALIADHAEKAAPASDPLVGNIDAVLKMLSQLASGLAHAHDRGVLHLDLKPANVLVADTGEPMLLDFNLSHSSFEEVREVVGGTVPYMAPEQLLDLKTRGKGEVDARTDLYSLGVIAFELFSGKHPFPVTSRTLAEFDGLMEVRQKGAPSLTDVVPDATPAVAAIVKKLLAPKPEDRYQSAADLRDDLERQLADRPLRFAADRSLPERFGKWRRRNPRVLVAMLLASLFVAAGGAGAYAFNETEKRAVGEAEARARDTKENLEALRLDLVLPNDSEARARGYQKALTILAEYGLPNDPKWQSGAAFQRVPEQQRAALAGDLGELLLLVGLARWEEGKTAEPKEAARDALLLNRQAATCFGNAPPPFLVHQKAVLEAALAEQKVEQPVVEAPATPRDKFLEAARLIAASHYMSAIDLLKKVVHAAPDHGAAHFCLAFCRQELGQYARSVERFETARSLLPKDPRPPFFCGISHGRMGKLGGATAAEEAFTQAIDLDPKRGDSYKNRAIARMELAKWRDADDDLGLALKNGSSPIQVYSLRIKVRDQLGDEAGAESDRKAFAEFRPERELDFMTLGCSRLPGDPKAALADFRSAGEKNPRSLAPLNNQAFVLTHYLKDDAGALKLLDRIAEICPEYAPARATRAVLLARIGKRDESHREIEAARKFSDAPNVTYRLACAYALTAKAHPTDRKKAVELLKQAFRDGYHEARYYESDPNLDELRELPEFAELLKALKGLL